MSPHDNRLGRNPFNKKSKPSKAKKVANAQKASSPHEPTVHVTSISAATIADVSAPTANITTATKDSATATAKAIQEEQIIGEMIDLPEEAWQPLTFAPAGFLKELLARWL